MIGYDLEDGGVVVLTMDDPEQSANTMNERFAAALPAALDRLAADVTAGVVTGVVVTSAKRTFFAGGDLHRMIRAQPADAARWAGEIDALKRQLRRLETLGVPVVAALNGSALGGGSVSAAATVSVGVARKRALVFAWRFAKPELKEGRQQTLFFCRMKPVSFCQRILCGASSLAPSLKVAPSWAIFQGGDR